MFEGLIKLVVEYGMPVQDKNKYETGLSILTNVLFCIEW
jgi:hypothetical protein